ncbi:flagellar L-ring protein precursor FlgH [Granulicella aggregans]|jgi:flagellar L-ring protein precursor FlgH|uniref:Flagellar L-ring protein FlgH n=1 Tax=Granulicella aggregans TaxID=474949 RepID=A0A7W7ZAT9_9BACT|nr:flagellar basal body L-ring protein FlgH [Granulicella aggregans]MBB5056377.1 flagellar L-ring protein precursor FlgH [Granulicella aggregans]
MSRFSSLMKGLCVVQAVGLATLSANAGIKPVKKTSQELRADYLTHLSEQYMPPPNPKTVGSLWSAANALGDLSSDYRARNVNDTIIVQVSVQTTAAQSGDVNSSRAFNAASGITGLVGDIATKGLNPLFNANSTSTLKGSGATASNTTFSTNLTGQIIAVLANGNMVIEAERKIAMNNQHEDLIIRGIVRPGDISSANTIPSAALGNLEIEMKGKGIISDSVRPPNILTRTVLWLFGF